MNGEDVGAQPAPLGPELEREPIEGQAHADGDRPRFVRVVRREAVPQDQDDGRPRRGNGRGRGVRHESGRGRGARRPAEGPGDRDEGVDARPNRRNEDVGRVQDRPPPLRGVRVEVDGRRVLVEGAAGQFDAAVAAAQLLVPPPPPQLPIAPLGAPEPAGQPDGDAEDRAEIRRRLYDTDWSLYTYLLSNPYAWGFTLLLLSIVGGLLFDDVFYYFVVPAIACGLGLRRRYRYMGRFHHAHPDRRPDSDALLQRIHADANYGVVNITASLHFYGAQFLVWPANWVYGDDLYLSAEMVSQVATISNLAWTADEDTAWLRINTALRSLHTVDYDRYLALTGVNVKQDTARYCFALYRRMVATAAEDFPLPVHQ